MLFCQTIKFATILHTKNPKLAESEKTLKHKYLKISDCFSGHLRTADFYKGHGHVRIYKDSIRVFAGTLKLRFYSYLRIRDTNIKIMKHIPENSSIKL